MRFSIILIGLMLTTSFCSFHVVNTSEAGLWYVDFEFWIDGNQTAFMTVTLVFSDTGYNLTGWETIGRDFSNFSGAAHFGGWEGNIVLYVICYESHSFSLGQLDEGVYIFTLFSVHDDFPYWYTEMETRIFEVGFPADINDDGKVDIKDVALVARAYGAEEPELNYNRIADVYYDGKIDIRDVSYTAIHFGET